MIRRIGLAQVEKLEADQTVKKWGIADLLELKAQYKQKLKDLKGGTHG